MQQIKAINFLLLKNCACVGWSLD